ncbi:transmembrane protease serine 9 [Embiotoca jacksoni]|uniref:transmembrane protease serine 9 n=1 Tax=Embiotoca jacksoni TaxID=100190 RepID=UPI0037044090
MKCTLLNLVLFYVLTCLRQNAHGSEIIKGKKVPDNMMLYMASVQSKGGHVCGGFLVSEDFVLTAAHCDNQNPTSVVLGTHNLKKIKDDTMRYTVKRCKYSNFDSSRNGDDIMLLKLSRKARLDNRVQPIQLPKTDFKVKNGAKCRVAGWGFTKTGGKVVDGLEVTDVRVVGLEDCKNEWKKIKFDLPNNVTCAGGYGTDKGFCQGDSGGPLVCGGVAAGIVSFNMRKNCDYPNVPNIYTDTSKYLHWIKNILKKKKCSTLPMAQQKQVHCLAGIMHGLHKFLLLHILTCLGRIAHGSHIIGGSKAVENTMLYMASVQNNIGHVCGGFLITDEFVVTAAHCMHDEPTHVVLGTHNLKTQHDIINIEKSFKPESFANVGLGNDIMLLKLSKKAKLGSKIQTIQLPAAEMNIKENETCSVAGWGKTRTHGSPVDDLRVVHVSVINKELCTSKWNGLPNNVICAGGYPANKGFCQGDSGGPLVCNDAAVGVVSFNRLSNCDYPDFPNIYTDISKYLPWIKSTIKG